MIKVSAGTAHVLGFKQLAMDALPTTAYLMIGEKCQQDCGFCPQARNATSRANLLSRVSWGECDPEKVVKAISLAYTDGDIERVCLQVVDGDNALAKIKDKIRMIKRKSEIPICVSAKIRDLEELMELAELGVDKIGLALDAACERVYKATKTGSWLRNLGLIEKGANLFPGKISTHLIVGLGETEQEMMSTIQSMKDIGVIVGLFAFTPVPGTRMTGDKPPKLDHYRRMQVAHFLITKEYANYKHCKFVNGWLQGFGLSKDDLKEILKEGAAFQTSGCPGCNRPYYNEKPGGTMYNYPRLLKPEEIDEAIELVINSLQKGGVDGGKMEIDH